LKPSLENLFAFSFISESLLKVEFVSYVCGLNW
jgi:hypothetical protein